MPRHRRALRVRHTPNALFLEPLTRQLSRSPSGPHPRLHVLATCHVDSLALRVGTRQPIASSNHLRANRRALRVGSTPALHLRATFQVTARSRFGHQATNRMPRTTCPQSSRLRLDSTPAIACSGPRANPQSALRLAPRWSSAVRGRASSVTGFELGGSADESVSQPSRVRRKPNQRRGESLGPSSRTDDRERREAVQGSPSSPKKTTSSWFVRRRRFAIAPMVADEAR